MMESDKDCAICLVEMESKETQVLPCKHVFHEKCAVRWLQGYQSTCPLCRSAVVEGRREVFEYWRRVREMVSKPDAEVDWGSVAECRRRAWEIFDRDPEAGAYQLELFEYWLVVKDMIARPGEEMDWEGLVYRPWFGGDPEEGRDEYSERIWDVIVNGEPGVEEEDWEEVVGVDAMSQSDEEGDSQLAFESGFDWDKLVEYFERNWAGDDVSELNGSGSNFGYEVDG